MKCIVVFSFWGDSPPDPLTRGSAPGPRWGHSPQTPIIGSRYRARHSPPNARTKLRLWSQDVFSGAKIIKWALAAATHRPERDWGGYCASP